jgi:hypothetical protein
MVVQSIYDSEHKLQQSENIGGTLLFHAQWHPQQRQYQPLSAEL